MGRKLIIKGADFSENAVSVSPVYEEVIVGTSESLWSYANTVASGETATYGFIAPYDMYVTGVTFVADSAPSGTTKVRIYNQGADSYSFTKSFSGVVAGSNTVKFSTPIFVQQGQIIGLANSNVLYCQPTVHQGDYPTNSSNGTVGQYATNPRCFRMNFYAEKEISD